MTSSFIFTAPATARPTRRLANTSANFSARKRRAPPTKKRTARQLSSKRLPVSKNTPRKNETHRPNNKNRAASNFLLRRFECELEENNFAHRARSQKRREYNLHAGIIPLAILLPERRP